MTAAAAVSTSSTFADLLRGQPTQAELAAHLDALDAAERVRQCRALDGAAQRRLWAACAGAPAFTLDDLVPGAGPVTWAGKNSLPTFSWFEKRFARQGGAVIGYNHQAMRWLTGPGYFTVVSSPSEPKELLFDYTRVPAEAPAGWPPIKPNTRGFSFFVYRNMQDFCRRVSGDVIIGSATRLGKPIDSYFVLARQ
jgi:hypothetical protein